MITTHNLGFPRIGKRRELKFALEQYWHGESTLQELEQTAAELREKHWQYQQKLDWLPVGDFSLYDHVLDTSLLVGNLPQRTDSSLAESDQYFQAARGQSSKALKQTPIAAAEMTKWFDTNYHYLVKKLIKIMMIYVHLNALFHTVLDYQLQNKKGDYQHFLNKI